MIRHLANTYRGKGLPDLALFPQSDAKNVSRLLGLCPAHQPTPLLDCPDLAGVLGCARVWIKDERKRMGLGSFKALGASFAIAREAEKSVRGGDWSTALSGRTFIAASAGNHGLSVAAGARVFGAAAHIYLAETVPEAFAVRLRAKAARVVRAGATYEYSMAAAEAASRAGRGTLLSDSSWPGYTDLPGAVMEGYLQLAAETVAQIDAVPTHIVLQAGVGGFAAAIAAHCRAVWGQGPVIIVVEPDAAPALFDSIQAGELVTSQGPVSAMGRLDCKTPSMIALAGLARDADMFMTITEEAAAAGVDILGQQGLATTPSGGAGLAALLAAHLPVGPDARVLAVLSEGAEDV